MVVVDGRGLPLGNYLPSASPVEVRLAETTLAAIRVGRTHRAGRPRQKPVRVIADKAYDSDPLRTRLQRRGIELICPHKKNRVRPATQDGRALRRYTGLPRPFIRRKNRSVLRYGAIPIVRVPGRMAMTSHSGGHIWTHPVSKSFRRLTLLERDACIYPASSN